MGVFGSWVMAHGGLSRWAALSSAAATAADMPLTYMVTSEQPTDRCRFTNVTGPIVFDIDLGTTMASLGISEWRLLALLYNNSSSTGTYSVIGSTSLGGLASPSYSSGTLPLWPSTDCLLRPRVHTKLWVPAGRSETYLRVTINDTIPRKLDATSPTGTSTATYFDIGQLIIAEGYATGDDGAEGGVLYTSPVDGLDQELRIVESEGGADFPRLRPQKNVRTFDLKLSGSEARDEFYGKVAAFRRYAGNARGVLLIEDLYAAAFAMDHMTYGLMTLNDVSIPANNDFTVQIRIRELI